MSANQGELWLIIPTAGRREYLDSIIGNSGIPKSRIVLVHTAGSTHVNGLNNLDYVGDFNIHSWWNLGIKFAEERGGKFVAVLNDDAQISFGCLQRMLEQMIREGSTLARPNGTWGHCWLLRVDRGIRPDEKFRWYMGDHDLEIRAKKSGGVSISFEETRNLEMGQEEYLNPEIAEIIARDYQTFFRRYKSHHIRHYLRRFLRFYLYLKKRLCIKTN